MELLESVDLMGKTTATCISIWCDLLNTKFRDDDDPEKRLFDCGGDDPEKRFDSLIEKSDDSEKLFRYFTYLFLYQTPFGKDKAVNFIKQKINERLNFINEELERIKVENKNANKIVVKMQGTKVGFVDKDKKLEEKIAMLPAKYVLFCRKYGVNITEEEAKQFIYTLLKIESVSALEGFFKPISKSSEEQDFYNELKSILIERLNYKKEKKQRKKESKKYDDALKRCGDYETQDDKFRSEYDKLKELLAYLEEKKFDASLQENFDSSLQSNAEKVIENVKAWFDNPVVDSRIKNQIRFLTKFQVDFMINGDEQIVIKELLSNNIIRTSIISFKNSEDYLLFKSLVKKIRGSIIEKNNIDSYVGYLDEEHFFDYIKETLICLILHGFFVEKRISFVNDVLPEFIDSKLRSKSSNINNQTPVYVRSLQLLNTKTDQSNN